MTAGASLNPYERSERHDWRYALKYFPSFVYFFKIPKTAGSSFAKDIADMIHPVFVYPEENCWAWPDHFVIDPRLQRMRVTMLRNPRAHVLSQYMHCVSSPNNLRRYGKRMPNFGAWLAQWVHLYINAETSTWNFTSSDGTVPDEAITPSHLQDRVPNYKGYPFQCYMPFNLQTQRLLCDNNPHFYKRFPSAHEAIANMADTDFVGIQEAYQESVCLLHARLHRSLPRYCDCTNSTSWREFVPYRELHGVPAYPGVQSYHEEIIKLVDLLTEGDRVLYATAVERFMTELAGAEKHFGVKVLCQSTLEKLSPWYEWAVTALDRSDDRWAIPAAHEFAESAEVRQQMTEGGSESKTRSSQNARDSL
eukprot:gnl/TRDRNA2_/TRDRNA2_159881_c0_seq3.p1 gnl/TRDRNA2_/TRDRNA2_159881_c0~~gnl/TRDRNA2_/TRDRNA2_159881_c0_seq3.p1  ORF type:complete len:364 (-),score=43.19 gnl/TRDRNA2_/TRDRNA2_159881_c0_seq3:20-1111(-)